MTNSVNAREIVLDMLIDMEKNGTPSHIVQRDTLKKYQYLDKSNRAFISKIFEGTVENRIRLDYIINSFSNTKTNKMKPFIRSLIRMSTYQLIFMDKTPDSAICNEAVLLAKKRGFVNLKGFVNGVLRSISRNKNNIKYPDREKSLNEFLSVYYSTPMWIINQISSQYGSEMLEKIIIGMNKPKEGISVRVSNNADYDKVIKSLENEGIEIKSVKLYDRGIIISKVDYLEKLSSFKTGEIIPQDVSSMLVSAVADTKKGDYIIDMCAAPGGKTIHLAELLDNTGCIDARDVSINKVMLISENIERMGIKNVKTKVFDGTVTDNEAVLKADVVIADVPCSGLGVTSKKSDIKYNTSYEKQLQLIKLQREILDNAVKYLKLNGKLIFSTCTINKEENIENMKWLIDKYNLVPEDISDYFPKDFHSEETKNGFIQLLPDIDETDGFFICRLKKQVQYE